MAYFAVFFFFALGIMALTMLGERVYRRLRETRVLLAAGWGVGLAWLANFNMWAGWQIADLRWTWVGTTLTGLALGGTALVALSIVGLVAGMYRKVDDEAEKIERTDLRKVS